MRFYTLEVRSRPNRAQFHLEHPVTFLNLAQEFATHRPSCMPNPFSFPSSRRRGSQTTSDDSILAHHDRLDMLQLGKSLYKSKKQLQSQFRMDNICVTYVSLRHGHRVEAIGPNPHRGNGDNHKVDIRPDLQESGDHLRSAFDHHRPDTVLRELG